MNENTVGYTSLYEKIKIENTQNIAVDVKKDLLHSFDQNMDIVEDSPVLSRAVKYQ